MAIDLDRWGLEHDIDYNQVDLRMGINCFPLRTKRPLTRLMLRSASPPSKLRNRGMTSLLRQYPFLQKPFTGTALIKKVEDVLANKQADMNL